MMLYIILLIAIAAFLAAYAFYSPFRELVTGWRTMMLATATAVVGVFQSFDIGQIVPPDQVGWWLLGIGVAMAILRVVTTGPLGKH